MSPARRLGQVLQALLLGLLLALALGQLVAVEQDARVFRYEAY